MKKFFNYIAWVTLTFCTVACSQEDLTYSYLSDSKAVHISAQIGENNVSGGFQTRSNPFAQEEQKLTKFNTGDKISVGTSDQNAITYTLDNNGTWTPEANKYLKWTSDNMLFKAYYPADKNSASINNFTVPTSYNSINDLADADYMTYSETQSNTSGNGITLSLKRKMARLIILIDSYGNQFNNNGYKVSKITIHSNTKGYNESGVVKENTQVTAYKYDGTTFYALLSPNTADTGADFLTVELNETGSASRPVKTTLKVKGIPTTNAGKSYVIRLIIGKDKAGIKGVTVSDWEEGTLPDGEATEKL